MIAVVSVPIGLEEAIGSRLGQGRSIPTKEAPEVDRIYFLVPLFTLAGTGLFERPEIEIQYFRTRAEAIAWGEADIERRLGEERTGIRALLIEAAERVRAKGER